MIAVLGIVFFFQTASQDLVAEGVASLRQGMPDRAIEQLTAAISAEPGRADAFFWRGRAYLVKGEGRPALADFDRVVNAGIPEFHYYQALGYFLEGRPAKVIEACDRAIAEKQEQPFAYCLKGIVLHQQGRYASSVTAFQHAVYVLNDFPLAYFGLAKALADAGDAYQAETQQAFACALQAVFCTMKDWPSAKEVVGLLALPPKPVSTVCDCCERFNQQGLHQERMGPAGFGESQKATAANLEPVQSPYRFLL